MNNKVERNANVIKTDLSKSVEKVNELLGKTKGFDDLARMNTAEGSAIFYEIGEIIEKNVIGPYGKSKVPAFAKMCRISAKTAYNILGLFRAAGDKSVILENPNLTRAYWYILGNIFKDNSDLLGDALRRNLIQFPIMTVENGIEDSAEDSDEASEPSQPKTKRNNTEVLRDICSVIRSLRAELKQSRILYAFKKFDRYLGKTPKSEKEIAALIKSKSDSVFSINSAGEIIESVTFHGENVTDNNCKKPEESFYLHSYNKGDEVKLFEARQKIAIALDTISLLIGRAGRIGLNVGAGTETLLKKNRVKPKKYAKSLKSVNRAKEIKQVQEDIRNKAGVSGNSDPLDLNKRLIHGKSEQVLKTAAFSKKMIDVVITDPPFGEYSEWRPHTKVNFNNPKTPEEAAELVANVAKTLVDRDLIQERFAWYSFCPIDKVHVFLPPLLKVFEGKDFISQVLIWNKVHAGKAGGYRTFARQCEAILYINAGRRPINATTENRNSDSSDLPESIEPRDAREMHNTLITFPVERKDFENEFWKPVGLMEFLVRLATGEDNGEKANRQIILDPFCGTGSTGVACVNCNRDFRLIDSHEGQFDSAVENLTIATAAQDMLAIAN